MADVYEPEFPSGAGAGRAREPERTPATERSIADLVKDIIGNVQEIIRSEIRLARAEMSQKISQAGRAGVTLAIGVVVGLYAVSFILVCIYNALATAVAAWLSALIVGVVLGLVALGMVLAGRKRLRALNPKPERTVETLKEDVRWLKNQTR